MNHYPHHIGDFDTATRHLTRVERSLYRDLIDLYYLTEKPLTSDFEKLARRILCDESDQKSLREVLNEFFFLEDDGYHNKRCDAEIAKYHGRLSDASKAGRVSAERRLNARSTTVERPLNKRTTTVQLTKNQEPRTKLENPKDSLSAEPSASSAGSIAFAAYADAYRERYQTDPVRNAKVNTIFANLAKQLGEDAAPVAAWYVRNEMLSTYVRSTHDPTLLLRDASGLCTRWKTGIAMTTKTARAADDSAGDVAMVQRVAARLENAMTVPMIAGNVVQLEDKRPLI